MNSINETGKAFFTHTKLNDRVVLRMSIGQTHTEEKHVSEMWNLLQKYAAELIGSE